MMQIANPLFIPGPTNIPERVRLAMARSAWDHRGPRFAELIRPLRERLAAVLGSREATVAFFTGSGTAGWEVALTNLLCSGDRVLATRHGMFSQRWIDLARRLGLEVEVIDAPWGEGIPADSLTEVLRADRQQRIRAVLAVHNETATGVISDIGAVRRALDAAGHPALLMVDGVSSIASLPFHMDDWGVDVAVAGSQKGFMLPTGLAIVAVSPRARAATAEHPGPRGYLDLSAMLEALEAGSYPYTPAVGLLEALNESLAMLHEEGLEVVYARHARIAAGVRAAVDAWGLELCARRPSLASDTVTTIRVPEGFSADAVVQLAQTRYGVSFGIGLGQLADRVFRIGHLGQMSETMALAGIATAEMTLLDLGFPITAGSGVAAAQDQYRQTERVMPRQQAGGA
jgi:alanine-glyoxylate transaminase/serine-glyoxylate transaminase/serine-pyruvate transaminase